jgi:NAD(P)-dependent dehydrogenase (short-subunit alcohol dehydrogenase family)
MRDNSRGLKEKVIVLTGGCGDIGGATAKKLAALGARVVLFDLLEESQGKVRARELGAVEYQRVDQGDEANVAAAIAAVASRYGRLDTVIGNAAIGSRGGLADLTAADWERSLRVNVIGCALLGRAAIQHMLGQTPDREGIRGKLLFTSSWVGVVPRPGAIDYCVGKAALNHLVREAAQEAASRGIRVNAVAPGILDAGLTSQAFQKEPALRDQFLALIPVGEFGTAEQIADAFVFLCSRESNYMTGQILIVDGGCSLTKPS